MIQERVGELFGFSERAHCFIAHCLDHLDLAVHHLIPFGGQIERLVVDGDFESHDTCFRVDFLDALKEKYLRSESY